MTAMRTGGRTRMVPKRSKSPVAARRFPRGKRWVFRVYVTDNTLCVRNTLRNLADLCEDRLPGKYAIEVVDLLETPERATTDEILAVPTVVRTAPNPVRRVIGDLSDVDRATVGLQLPI